MVCSTCHAPIPEGQLSCRPCLDRRARAAAFQAQAAFVPFVLSGRIEFFLRRHGKHGPWHVALFNAQHLAYCGEPVEKCFSRESATWNEGELKRKVQGVFVETMTVCPRCFEKLREVVAAVSAKAARAE